MLLVLPFKIFIKIKEKIFLLLTSRLQSSRQPWPVRFLQMRISIKLNSHVYAITSVYLSPEFTSFLFHKQSSCGDMSSIVNIGKTNQNCSLLEGLSSVVSVVLASLTYRLQFTEKVWFSAFRWTRKSDWRREMGIPSLVGSDDVNIWVSFTESKPTVWIVWICWRRLKVW